MKSIEAQRIFQNNIIVNNKKVQTGDTSFSPNNFWVQDFSEINFINFAQNDFRLAPKSRFRGKGKDGGDIGSNLTLDSPAK